MTFSEPPKNSWSLRNIEMVPSKTKFNFLFYRSEKSSTLEQLCLNHSFFKFCHKLQNAVGFLAILGKNVQASTYLEMLTYPEKDHQNCMATVYLLGDFKALSTCPIIRTVLISGGSYCSFSLLFLLHSRLICLGGVPVL